MVLSQLSLWVGILVLLFGAMFCVKDRLGARSVAFLILTVMIAGWLIPSSAMYSASEAAQADQRMRIVYVFVPGIAPAVYMFTVFLLNLQGISWHRLGLFIAWALGVTFMVLAQAGDAFVASVTMQPWGYYPEYGWLGWPFILFFLVVALGPMAVLGLEHARTRVVDRRRKLRWVMMSFGVSYVSILDFVPKLIPQSSEFVLAGFHPVAPVGHICIFAFSVFNTIILFRQFFDVSLTAAQILQRILPTWIVKKIAEGETNVFQTSEAAVLFADMVGFTRLIPQLSAREQVRFLDKVFTNFDNLARHHRVERIKTLGDGYMAVAWLEPGDGEETASVRLARMALDMATAIADDEDLCPPRGERVKLRIGIDKGLVTGGIAGLDRLQYDVWGSTVNMASRMESHGVPGKVTVSDAVKDAIEGACGRGQVFRFLGPDTVDFKGIGPTQRWTLEVPLPGEDRRRGASQ